MSNMFAVHSGGGYCENILEKLWQQCGSEDLCDVVFIAGANEKRIPAHRLILSVTSEYFRGMFSSSMLESTKKEIELPSVDGDALQSLVEYCYKGRVVISADIVVEVVKTADMLLLPNVVTLCANLLEDRLHPSNCLGMKTFAEQYRCETLLQKAKDYSLGYFSDVCKTDEFFSLNAEQLRELLVSDDLYVSAEEEVFKSVKQWIDYDPIEREKYKEELLRLVRMPLLERSFLDEHVKPICTSAECLQIYIEGIETQLLSDQKKVTPRNSTRRDEFLMAISRGGNYLFYIHYYCPQQLKWMKGLKHLECHDVCFVTVMAEHVYIVGGFEAQYKTGIYLNLRTMSSRHISPMKQARTGSQAIALKEFLYVIGGFGKSSAEKWNPKTDSWSNIPSMSTDRYDFNIAILYEKIYVVGGFSHRLLNTAECFDPDKNEWTNIAPMSTNRIYFGLAIWNGKIYVIGGQSENEILNTAEYYDPDINVWTRIANMHHCRSSPGVVVANGLLYAVRGDERNTSVECYDPKANNWSIIRIFCADGFTSFHRCITFSNKVVVFSTDRFEEYDPETNEWNVTSSFNGVLSKNAQEIFLYSGKLLRSEFVEN